MGVDEVNKHEDSSSIFNRDRSDSEDKAIETEQIEQGNYEATPIGKGSWGYRIKKHFARWWWVHLIIFCALFLIISLCLVYAAMPHIAQHGVNESSLEITGIDFLEPTSDSLVLAQRAIIHSPSMYTPTLDPFDAASYLVTNGTFAADPMLYIPMPKIHALHPKSNATVAPQLVHIDNLEEVTAYATAVLSNEWVSTALVGKTKLHEGKLPTITIKYNTTATYRGLNGLKGFNVTGAKIDLKAAPGAPNLNGFAYIPNPSLLTIAMGNVTLILSTAKAGVVGNTTINDMTLRPGNNTLPMTSIIDEAKVLSSMEDPKTGIVELFIIGNTSVYNGQHLTYYERALSSNKLTLEMNVTQVLADSIAAPSS